MINEIAYSDYHEIIAYELRAALRRYFEQWDEVSGKPTAEKREIAHLFPRELIREIMKQGYTRKVAHSCSIEFHHKPPRVEKADCIIVKSMGKEIARLKPLKFYNMV